MTQTRETEYGTEKQCGKCKEWWPDTNEFFPRSANGILRSPCKACIDEKRRETNTVKPCCVPGCTNPRYYWRYSRCKQHQREYGQLRYRRKKQVQP